MLTFVAMLVLALLITVLVFDSKGEGFKIFMISYAWAVAISANSSSLHLSVNK